jgi:hypothetical protein
MFVVKGMFWLMLAVFLLLAGNYAKERGLLRERDQAIAPILLEPYLHTGDNKPTKLFHAGDVVFLHTDSRTTACNADLHYRIITETKKAGPTPADDVYNRIVWFSYPQTRTSTNIGHYHADVRLVLPDWLRPGEYLIDRNVVFDCGVVRVPVVAAIPFTIVSSSSISPPDRPVPHAPPAQP